ncbi:hypothetical protein MTP99_010632 [Tenebrio molitor]|nr:hypothetical protein MTP99_010632 [Tenebrio molitor]
MGLLLSVLVACVGVVELLAFYSNVSRSLVTTSTQTPLPDLAKRYHDSIEDLQRNLQNQTRTNNNVVECETKTESSCVQISSENIEVEFADASVPKSRSPSPRRFFLLEREGKERSPSPRHFLVANANVDSEIENLPKYVVEQQNETGEAAQQKQYIIRSEEVKSTPPIPLPKQFVVTEREPTIVESVENPRSRSPSPIPKRLGEQDSMFRRSPSPYPSLVLSVPRNSICSELLDNPTISVVEVDEEYISRSPTPEKLDFILESKHNTTEFWTNKILVVPPTKQRSHSPECRKLQKAGACSLDDNLLSKPEENKSQSESVQLKDEIKKLEAKFFFEFESKPVVDLKESEASAQVDDEIEIEVKEYDEQFLDSLDGVSKKKLCRNSASRRSRKKRAPNVPTDSNNESKG